MSDRSKNYKVYKDKDGEVLAVVAVDVPLKGEALITVDHELPGAIVETVPEEQYKAAEKKIKDKDKKPKKD